MSVQRVDIHIPTPHAFQKAFIDSPAKRKIVRAGRRSGKTTGVAILALEQFLAGHRILYSTPTAEQLNSFWQEVSRALAPAVDAGLHKNETEHFIERAGTENRIKAKTAWDPDTLRGDYADKLILDEYQLMAETTWDEVGAPMLLDNNGDAIFVYTPPSIRGGGISKAADPRHASKLFALHKADPPGGRWATFHFTSLDNPHISHEALGEITQDMSQAAYRQEILAEDEEVSLSMLVYGMFQEATCKIARFPIPVSWPRYVGHDFGIANPAALFFAQDPATGYIYIYQEYLPGSGRTVSQHVSEFKRLAEGVDVRKRVGGSHQEEEIRQAYTAHGWPIQEPHESGSGAVKVQLDRVRGMMEQNKLFVFNDLYNYLGELATCTWDVDSNGVRLDKIRNERQYHLGACARYLLSDFRPDTVRAVSRKPVAVRSW